MILMVYLNQIKEVSGIPLYYVLRDPEMEDAYRSKNDTVENLIYDAEFKGRAYEQDSFKVM